MNTPFLNPLRELKRNLKISYHSLTLASLVYYWLMKIASSRSIIFVRPRTNRGKIMIRKNNKVDINVIYYVFVQKFHLPPSGVTIPDDPVIVDIGCNIGLTIIDYKHLFKNSKVYGFELDKENYELAVANCSKLKNVSINNLAVWVHSQGVYYDSKVDSDSYSINEEIRIKEQKNHVRSTTIKDIIHENNIDLIHFLKMDIEGAEKYILMEEDISWMDKVMALNIEIHDCSELEINQILEKIRSKNFTAWKDTYHWNAIMAYKNQ